MLFRCSPVPCSCVPGFTNSRAKARGSYSSREGPSCFFFRQGLVSHVATSDSDQSLQIVDACDCICLSYWQFSDHINGSSHSSQSTFSDPVYTYPGTFENGSFFLRFAVASTRKRRFRQPKTEIFENALQSGDFRKRRFRVFVWTGRSSWLFYLG